MHILALHYKKKKNVPLIIEGYLGLVGFIMVVSSGWLHYGGELGNLLKAVKNTAGVTSPPWNTSFVVL